MDPQLLWTRHGIPYRNRAHCPKSFMKESLWGITEFTNHQSICFFFNLPPDSAYLAVWSRALPLRILLQETMHSFLNKLCALSHLAAHVVFSPSLPLLFPGKNCSCFQALVTVLLTPLWRFHKLFSSSPTGSKFSKPFVYVAGWNGYNIL